MRFTQFVSNIEFACGVNELIHFSLAIGSQHNIFEKQIFTPESYLNEYHLNGNRVQHEVYEIDKKISCGHIRFYYQRNVTPL